MSRPRSFRPRLSGVEPSLRDVDATVRALLAHLDGRFGLVLLREARAALQAEVLGGSDGELTTTRTGISIAPVKNGVLYRRFLDVILYVFPTSPLTAKS